MSSKAIEQKRPNPWWVGLVSGMASYIDSCAIISSGLALTVYQLELGLSNTEFGFLSSGLTFAIAVGALLGGRLGDKYGRKPVFAVTMAFIVIGALLLIFTRTFALLLVGMLLVGAGTGADLPVSLATISEACTDDNRGKIIGLSNLLWTIGIVASQAVGALVGDWGYIGGQIMFGHVFVIATIVLMLRMTIPESHVWLAARASSNGSSTAKVASIFDLLHGRYAKPFIALVLFYSLVNLGANTNGQFNTWVNVNIIGMAVSLSSVINLVLYFVQMLFNVVFMKYVDTPKRMPLFYFGAICFVGSYLVYPIFGFSTTTFIAYMLINSIGAPFAFEGIMKVWAQESFPTLLRTTAQGGIVAIARFAAAIVGSFTASLIALSPSGAYVGLACFVAVGFAFAIWGFHGKRGAEFASEHASGMTA